MNANMARGSEPHHPAEDDAEVLVPLLNRHGIMGLMLMLVRKRVGLLLRATNIPWPQSNQVMHPMLMRLVDNDDNLASFFRSSYRFALGLQLTFVFLNALSCKRALENKLYNLFLVVVTATIQPLVLCFWRIYLHYWVADQVLARAVLPHAVLPWGSWRAAA